MIEAGRGLGNIAEKFLRDILSTTDQGTYICSHRSIRHAASTPVFIAVYSSVTKMLLELRLPSFHTVLMNGRSIFFHCIWEKCKDSIVQFLSSMSL